MYLIYVDESGQRDINEKCSRYFVLAAVAVREERWGRANFQLSSIKQLHFGTSTVEVKSNWLRNPTQRKKRYLDPLNITDEAVTAVAEGYYDVLSNFKAFAVVVDKKAFATASEQQSNELSVTNLAYMSLVELIGEFLSDAKESKRAMLIHDMIQAPGEPSKGHQKETCDLHAFAQWLLSFAPSKLQNIIEDVYFASSAKSNFLQMADIVAYNVWAQYDRYGPPNGIGVEGTANKTYDYFERILPQFHHGQPEDVYKNGIRLVLKPPSLSALYKMKEFAPKAFEKMPLNNEEESDFDEE